MVKLWDSGAMGWFYLKVRKMVNSLTTHPSIRKHLHSLLTIAENHSLMDWNKLACREGWPSEGGMPGDLESWKTVEELQALWCEWQLG